ncbi:MAG: hypothetical protein IPL22_20955 [Bacteroidetes bacterium]|nr:hypothetical protein [Bacteroidota bacterium]
MKTFYLCLTIFIFNTLPGNIQAQSVEWANKGGGVLHDPKLLLMQMETPMSVVIFWIPHTLALTLLSVLAILIFIYVNMIPLDCLNGQFK